MIAIQFIPPTPGVTHDRRIDLASLAGCFGEPEETTPRDRRRQATTRIAMLILVLLGAIGDTVLISQRESLASSLAMTAPTRPIERAAAF